MEEFKYSKDVLQSMLYALGLSKQQVENKTITKLIDAIGQDENIPSRLLAGRVADLDDDIQQIRNRYERSAKRLEDAIVLGEGLMERLKMIGQVSDTIYTQEAKDALALWSAMLDVAEKKHLDLDQAAVSIGYMIYAVFGGQASRINIGGGFNGRTVE